MKVGATFLLLAIQLVEGTEAGRVFHRRQDGENHGDASSRNSLRQSQDLYRQDVRHLRGGNKKGKPRKGKSQSSRKRVVVKYDNDEGRKEAIRMGGVVHHEFAAEKLIVLDLDEDSIAYLDKLDDNILRVEDDNIWTAQGYLERHYDPTGKDGRGRQLLEEVPYGISMVQADQVEIGPYPVKVCIADTGAARNHPDLAAATMSGTDRYSDGQSVLRWANDLRGHGTHVSGTVAATPNNGIGVRGIGKIPVHVTRALVRSFFTEMERQIFE